MKIGNRMLNAGNKDIHAHVTHNLNTNAQMYRNNKRDLPAMMM